MTFTKFQIHNIPTILYGEPSDRVWLFIHGKCGYKAFAKIACPKGIQVLSIDLPEHGERNAEIGFDPWHVVPERQKIMAYLLQRWVHIFLRANSIGGWFFMLAFADTPLEQALFVSPVLDMEKLISRTTIQW